MSKMTRRRLALALGAAGSAMAQNRAPQTAGAAPQAQTADPLQQARDNAKRNSEALARYPLPQSTEPAFAFKP